MKKKVLFMSIVFFLLIPVFVFAENNTITIESIELREIYGNALINEEATIDNDTIINNISLNKVGDYVDYIIHVKNNGDEDYSYSVDSDTNNYVSYELSQEDGNTIKKGEELDLTLRIKYENEVPENLFNNEKKFVQNNNIDLLFGDASNNIIDIIDNPKTRNNYIVYFLILCLIVGIISLKNKKTFFLILLISIFIPNCVKALQSITIKVSNNITFIGRDFVKCHYDGELVAGAVFQNGSYTYRYLKELRDLSNASDTSWLSFQIPADGWGVSLTDKNYTGEVNGVFCSYINEKPVVSMTFMYANSRASHFDLSTIDSSNVKNMYGMFYGTNTDYIDFSVMDTSNVENMYGVFHTIKTGHVKLDGINTSKVTSMPALFYASELDSVDLSTWDTSNVTNFQGMFCFSNIRSVNLLGLDTSKVTQMDYMFYRTAFTELDLSSFDTSHVTNFADMLFGTSARVGYARTVEDAARLNSSFTGKPNGLTFVVKNT